MWNGETEDFDKKEGDRMDFSAKKAIIFDLDGTLLDTLADLRNSLNEALVLNGLPARTTDEVRRFVGNGIATLAARAVPDDTDNLKYDAVLADTRRLYAQKCREHTKPYDGISELLTALHEKGYLLAVVSNKPNQQVKKLCAEFFGTQIRVAIGHREGAMLKPAPDSLLTAVQELGCTVGDAVYAGDSDVDILTAQNAGIPCISVLWGFRDRDVLDQAGGTYFAHTPAEIGQFFQLFL